MQSRTRKPKGRRTKPRRKQQGGIDRNKTLIQTYGKIQQNKLNFLPPWLEAPMRYGDSFILTVLSFSVADYIFRANSLFDPDRTSGGHQPLGYDQLTPSYNRYRVDKFDWKISLPSTAVTYSATVVPVNGAASLTSSSLSQEYPLADLRTVGFNGGPSAIFHEIVNLPELNGKSMIAYNTDDTTGSLTTTNPVETIDLHIFLNNPNTVSLSCQVNVKLFYRAVFYDPITPGQSFDKCEKPVKKWDYTRPFFRSATMPTPEQVREYENLHRAALAMTQ
jgi:hypothetical protein